MSTGARTPEGKLRALRNLRSLKGLSDDELRERYIDRYSDPTQTVSNRLGTGSHNSHNSHNPQNSICAGFLRILGILRWGLRVHGAYSGTGESQSRD